MNGSRPKTRQDRESVRGLREIVAQYNTGLPHPEGYEALFNRDPLMRTCWEEFTKTRASPDWRPADLRALARLTLIEVQLHRLHDDVATEGPMIETSMGPVENPRVATIEKFEKFRRMYAAQLSVYISGTDSRVINRRGKDVTDAGRRLEGLQDDGLLARPN